MATDDSHTGFNIASSTSCRRLHHISSVLTCSSNAVYGQKQVNATGPLGRLRDSLPAFLGRGRASNSEQHRLFQPTATEEWPTVSATETRWDADKLDAVFQFAERAMSTGLLITLNGKILREQYWAGSLVLGGRADDHSSIRTPDDVTDIASAQKGVIALLFGIAHDKGLISAGEAVSKYIPRWTHAGAEDEDKITIEHLLTMSTGLGAQAGRAEGPGGGGLYVSAEAGSVWKYNTVAYMTGSHCLLPMVTGMSLQTLTREWLLDPIGCTDASGWKPRVKHTDPPNNGDSTMLPRTVGFFSSPRDMARLGLLLLGSGCWNGTPKHVNKHDS